MYDNDGVGAPQEEVKPIFDMRAANKAMAEFDGDLNPLPIAEDVVYEFVKDYKNVHSKLTPYGDGYDTMPLDTIQSVLEENHNDYKEDKEIFRIASEAVYDLQHSTIVRGNSLAGQGQAVVGDAQTKATDDSGRLSDVSATQIRTIAKGITSDLPKKDMLNSGVKK